MGKYRVYYAIQVDEIYCKECVCVVRASGARDALHYAKIEIEKRGEHVVRPPSLESVYRDVDHLMIPD